MHLSRLGRFAALACLATLVLAVSCASPSSPSTTNSGGTGGSSDTSKLGFESGFDPTTVSAYEGSVQGGTMGMVFSLDTPLAYAGASSLKCSGTSRQNAYGTDYFGEATVPLSATDFTNKPISVAVYVPAGSKVYATKLILMNAAYNESQFPQQNIVPGSWTTLTFDMTKAGFAWDYQTAGATAYTAATSLRFRFMTQDATGTPASAPVDVNLDSVNW